MKLQDKVAVITGGNSGIGRSIAEEFERQGAKVVVFGRNQETLDATVNALSDEAIGVQGDVSNGADLDRLFSEVEARHGRIDVLVANAGIAPPAPIEQVDEAHVDSIFGVNVKGLFFTVQKALPLFSEGASVIFTGSAVTYRGMANMSIYAASKAAVRSLARTLSAELLPRGVRVNVLSPGPIETPIFGRMGLPQEALDEMAAGITQQVPMGRFGSAQEMASAALFLASSDSSYVVGADLLADGGFATI